MNRASKNEIKIINLIKMLKHKHSPYWNGASSRFIEGSIVEFYISRSKNAKPFLGKVVEVLDNHKYKCKIMNWNGCNKVESNTYIYITSNQLIKPSFFSKKTFISRRVRYLETSIQDKILDYLGDNVIIDIFLKGIVIRSILKTIYSRNASLLNILIKDFDSIRSKQFFKYYSEKYRLIENTIYKQGKNGGYYYDNQSFINIKKNMKKSMKVRKDDYRTHPNKTYKCDTNCWRVVVPESIVYDEEIYSHLPFNKNSKMMQTLLHDIEKAIQITLGHKYLKIYHKLDFLDRFFNRYLSSLVEGPKLSRLDKSMDHGKYKNEILKYYHLKDTK